MILLQESKILTMEEIEKLYQDFSNTLLLQGLIDLLISKNLFSEEELQNAYQELTSKLAAESILAKMKIDGSSVH